MTVQGQGEGRALNGSAGVVFLEEWVMTVYVCGPEFESILCGIYDAWMSGKGHGNVRLEIRGANQDMELFSEYVDAADSREKAEKVLKAMEKRLSWDSFRKVYAAALSCEPGRADAIYRFLIEAFRLGREAADRLQEEAVYEVFRLSRRVYNESHCLTEFIRFSQVPGDMLISRIGPENDVLPLVSPHFADRMPGENWIICDENRRKAAVHPAGKSWFILHRELAREEGREGEPSPWQACLQAQGDEAAYQRLWKTFFNSVAIEERHNPVCQRTHLPLKYRRYMTEFQG